MPEPNTPAAASDGRDFWVYAMGVVCTSICTSLTPEEATERLNREHPTGVSSRWEVSEDKTFADGRPNPSPCPDHPDTHKHYLFSC